MEVVMNNEFGMAIVSFARSIQSEFCKVAILVIILAVLLYAIG